MLRLRPVAQRAGWGLADQALSSFTNFALGVVIARTVGIEEFGAFSLAFALYLLVGSVCRAYPMEPLAIRYGASSDATFRPAAAAATGSVLGISLAGSAALLMLTAVIRGEAGEAILALAITFPGLLVQDAWRSTFFAWRRGRDAFANDLVWALCMVPSMAVLVVTGDRSVLWPTMAWGGASTVAALVGVWQARLLPDPRLARRWWHEHISLGPRFILEALTRTAGGQISTYAIGVVAGLSALGALRAAQLVIGPVQIFFLGIGLVAVPEGVRALGHSRRRLWLLAVTMSSGLVALAVAWGIVALLLPEALGEALLGPSWDPARLVLFPVIIAQVATVAGAGAAMGLRTLAAARLSLRANAVASVAVVVIGVAGAAAAGTEGAAWGFAIAASFGSAVWWRAFAAAFRDPQLTPNEVDAIEGGQALASQASGGSSSRRPPAES
jgi:O-antigen/teichoic acid export membrane protein